MYSLNNTGNRKTRPKVPPCLRVWFLVHFAVDIASAIPLFILPVTVLGFLGWENADPITTRLFAAALFGIGTESFLGRNSGVEAYNGMLNLKIIWSFFASLAILLSLTEQTFDYTILPVIVLLIFVLFNLLWIYWKIRLHFLFSEQNDE